MISADSGELLSQVLSIFKRDVATLPFDWVESVNKELQILVNCGLELSASKIYVSAEASKQCEILLTIVKLPQNTDSVEHEIVARSLNLIGKICKVPEGKL